MESKEIKLNISEFAEQGATIEQIGEILQIDNFIDLFNQNQDWQDSYNEAFLKKNLKLNDSISGKETEDVKIIKLKQELLNKQIIAKTLKKYHF